MVRDLGQSSLFDNARAFEVSQSTLTQAIVSLLMQQGIKIPETGTFRVVIQSHVGNFIVHLIPKDKT